MSRCLVLNANYEFLSLTASSLHALSLVITEKVDPLAHYDRVLRSQYQAFPVPAVVVMRRMVRTRRRRTLFDTPVKSIVFARDRFHCQYCGSRVSMKSGTRDHVIPRCRGGRDSLANIVTACGPCNTRKDSRTPAEAGMPLLSQPRSLTEEEKLSCLMQCVKREEREIWLDCLSSKGISLWTARAA